MPPLQWNRRVIAPSACLLPATPGVDQLAFMWLRRWPKSTVSTFCRTFWNWWCSFTSQMCSALMLLKSSCTWTVLLPTSKKYVRVAWLIRIYFAKERWLANSLELFLWIILQRLFYKWITKAEISHGWYVEGFTWGPGEAPSKTFRNSLESWPRYVLAIHKAHGNHAPSYWSKLNPTLILAIFQSQANVRVSTCKFGCCLRCDDRFKTNKQRE